MDANYRELKEWLDKTQNEPLETMAAFFNARVDSYEEHMSRWKRQYAWMAQLLPAETETLLDIGCGTGLELDCIFSRFSHLRITGIDLSESMLAVLSQKHADKALTLICGDYFQQDFGESRFDAVVAFETLHHFTAEKKHTLFERVRRALKPGGIFLECDYIATSQEIEDLAASECRRRRLRDKVPDTVFVHFDTPLTLAHEMEALRNAGFASVELVGFLPEDDHTPMLRAVK